VLAKVRQRLEARLIKIQGFIEAAEDAQIEAMANGISSFELDTGEADQKVIFKNPKTFNKYLDNLYATEEWICRRLAGRTFTAVKVRRK
jgi:hypothetical protein